VSWRGCLLPSLLVFLSQTRITALLRGLFGKGADRVKVSHKSFKVKSRVIEIATLGSNYHIEINPSDVGISDRHVVQEVRQRTITIWIHIYHECLNSCVRSALIPL
jgi:hypothetical protein